MCGAETSQIMLPCWRRVHLHKSAKSVSFKTIFEQIQKSHKKDAHQIDPKMIRKQT